MRARTLELIVAFTITFLPGIASAQDTPKIGLSMGYPAAIGVIWHVTDRLALRPEISVTKSATEFIGSSLTFSSGGVLTNTTTSTTLDTWQVGVGLSALFYLSKHDALRTYLSPRYAYTRQSSSPSSSNTPTSVVTGSNGHGNFVSGAFGAEYALGDRFSVFGEIGLGYSRTVSSPTSSLVGIGGSTASNLSTRSGAGVILYF
jgi:opacity protein-like surface antigen